MEMNSKMLSAFGSANRTILRSQRILVVSYCNPSTSQIKHATEDSLSVGSSSVVLLSTRDHIEGTTISKEIGLVAGSSVKSRGFLYDIWARIRGLTGGELRSYGELLSSSSSEATRRMMREAENINADAVVRVRYQVSSTADPISGAYCYVLCSGTAVQLKKE